MNGPSVGLWRPDENPSIPMSRSTRVYGGRRIAGQKETPLEQTVVSRAGFLNVYAGCLSRLATSPFAGRIVAQQTSG